ncbi:hypothetical protein [Pandoraea sp. PE-S2R-1]|uniref:hypothetical protein n=1 Tax=Pandoraea sp. PE-S2R-1 TaxID=1986994 RepID=UPI000B40461D|nr:hypothetical protein [Pandoraea sp. PE-S2R-1]
MMTACPHCQSSQVVTRNHARKVGGILGAIAGAASGFTAAMNGARIGGTLGGRIGLIAGPPGAALGTVAGAIVDFHGVVTHRFHLNLTHLETA